MATIGVNSRKKGDNMIIARKLSKKSKSGLKKCLYICFTPHNRLIHYFRHGFDLLVRHLCVAGQAEAAVEDVLGDVSIFSAARAFRISMKFTLQSLVSVMAVSQ